MSDADPHERHGQALLAAYRDHTGPDPAATERLLAALRRDTAREDRSQGTGTSGHVQEDSEAPPAVRRLHPTRRWVLAAALLAAAVVAAYALAPQTGARRSRDDDAAAAFQPGPTSAGTARERREPTPPAEPPAQAEAAIEPEPRAPRTRAPAPPAPTPSLADEMQRMRPAQLALAAGDPRGALALLDTYARDFPDGRLLEEHAALHAIARCQLGAPEGPTEAAEFLRARPTSMFAGRVRAACGSP